MLSVFLRYTDSDYPFGIFKPFLPCVGVVVSLISPYGVDVSLLDRCVRAFELKKKRYSVRLYPQLFAGGLISNCVVFDCLRIVLSCLVFAFLVPYCSLRFPDKNDVWFVLTPG